MTFNSKAKGSKFEREVVNMAKSCGLQAERTAPLQGVGRSGGADVLINGSIHVECKSRARISGWTAIISSILLHTACPLTKEQEGWLEGQDWLALKQTGWPVPIAVFRIHNGQFIAQPLLVKLMAEEAQR